MQGDKRILNEKPFNQKDNIVSLFDGILEKYNESPYPTSASDEGICF